MREKIIENNGRSYTVWQFEATLKSVASEVMEFNNENKTQYRPCNIDFIDTNGEMQNNITAMVYEKSFQDGMVIGEKYSAQAEVSDTNVYITVFQQAYAGKKASTDMFGVVSSGDTQEETVLELAKAADAVV